MASTGQEKVKTRAQVRFLAKQLENTTANDNLALAA